MERDDSGGALNPNGGAAVKPLATEHIDADTRIDRLSFIFNRSCK